MEKIQIVNYLDLECMIYNDEIYKNYINVSKWAENSRTFSNWYRSDSSKQIIKYFQQVLETDNELIIKINNVSNSYKGTYVHMDLAIHIAQWISFKFAFKVSQIIKLQLISKYKTIIQEKDNKIDNLQCKIDELLKKSDELLRKSSDLIKKSDELLNDNETTYNMLSNKELITSVNKIDNLTDLVSDIAVNVVPTDKWNKLGIFKTVNNDNKPIYKVVRCLKLDYNSRIKKYNNCLKIFEIDLPNDIDYFSSFRELYARNKIIKNNIVSIFFNDICLINNTTEEMFISMLETHRLRIETKINKIID